MPLTIAHLISYDIDLRVFGPWFSSLKFQKCLRNTFDLYHLKQIPVELLASLAESYVNSVESL
jgi:hypothetical protein